METWSLIEIFKRNLVLEHHYYQEDLMEAIYSFLLILEPNH